MTTSEGTADVLANSIMSQTSKNHIKCIVISTRRLVQNILSGYNLLLHSLHSKLQTGFCFQYNYIELVGVLHYIWGWSTSPRLSKKIKTKRNYIEASPNFSTLSTPLFFLLSVIRISKYEHLNLLHSYVSTFMVSR